MHGARGSLSEVGYFRNTRMRAYLTLSLHWLDLMVVATTEE